MTAPWPNNEPIYYVVVENVPRVDGRILFAILRVIACDYADVNQMYETHINPLYASGRRVQAFVFLREPPNPLRKAIEDAESDPGAVPAL